MLAKKTSKNQITLPKTIVSVFPGAEYFDVRAQDGKIVLTPVRIMPTGANLHTVREKMEKLGITKKDVEEAIQWARSRKR